MKAKQFIIPLAAVAIFIAGGLFIVLMQWLLTPRPGSQSVTMYKDWRLSCQLSERKASVCNLTQDIVNKAGQIIVRLAMGSGRNDGKLVVIVPHEVLLQPGFGLSVGKTKVLAARYETCNRVGCQGTIPIDVNLQDAIRDNDDGQVVFVGLDSKPVLLRYSLRGFAEGRVAFDSASNKQNAWWGFLIR